MTESVVLPAWFWEGNMPPPFPATLPTDCDNCEQLLSKLCAECEHAQKRERLAEDPMVSKILIRWINGELRTPT
jgi:hypothetical protein